MLDHIQRWKYHMSVKARRKARPLRERGVTLVEYALLLSLIAVVAIGSLVLIGKVVSHNANNIGNQLALGDAYNADLPAPTITLSAPGSNLAGSTLTPALGVNLSGQAANAGGTISVYVYEGGVGASAPASCSSPQGGDWQTVATGIGVNGATNNYAPGAFSTDLAGNYYWYATYSGDANDNRANSGCGGNMVKTQVIVANPTLALTVPGTDSALTPIANTDISVNLTTAATQADGTITIYVEDNTTEPTTNCGGVGWTTVGTITPLGDGSYNPASSYIPLSAGTYWWYVTIGADTYDAAANTPCGGTMPKTTVTEAQPTLTLTVPNADTAGSPIDYTSIDGQLQYGAAPVTGTIHFYVSGVYSPGNQAPTSCTAGFTQVGTGTTVNGNNTYNPDHNGFRWTPTAAGVYYWYASYTSGNLAVNQNSASSCGIVETTVSLAAPTLALDVPGNDAIGAQITNANITGVLTNASTAATGTETFSVYYAGNNGAPPGCTGAGWTVAGTGTVDGTGTSSTIDTNPSDYEPPYTGGYTPTKTGTYYWYVTYSGDTYDGPTGTPCGGSSMPSTVVANGMPSLTIAAPGTDGVGTTVYPYVDGLDATLTGASGYANKQISFFVYFAGNGGAPGTCGGSGWTPAGTATVDGSGTYYPNQTWTPTSIGNYFWYASYPGDNYDSNALSPCPSTTGTTVTQDTPTLNLAYYNGFGPPIYTGTEIPNGDFYVYLNNAFPDATGSIGFYYYESNAAPTSCSSTGPGTEFGSVSITGQGGDGLYQPSGSGGFTPPTAGDYWIYAYYPGDTDDTSAVSECDAGMTEITVTNATPTLAVVDHTDTVGAGNAATASVSFQNGSASANGTVSFEVFGPSNTPPNSCKTGWQAAGTATVSGNGTYPGGSFTTSTLGDYWWYATFPGDADDNAANSVCGGGMPETVVKTASTIALTVSPDPIPHGNPATVRWTVTPNGATGNVTVSEGADSPNLCTGNAPTGTCPLADVEALAPGTYTLTATYAGNATYAPSTSNSVTLIVTKTTPNFTLQVQGPTGPPGTSATITYGQEATFTANLPPDATGTVTVSYDGTTCTIDLSYGTQCGTSFENPIPPGTYSGISASYSGDADYNATPSTNSVTLTVNKATPNMSVAGALNRAGTALTFTATVAGVNNGANPTGSVGFTVTYVPVSGHGTPTTVACNPASATLTTNFGVTTATCQVTTNLSNADNYTAAATYSGDGNYAAITTPVDSAPVRG